MYKQCYIHGKCSNFVDRGYDMFIEWLLQTLYTHIINIWTATGEVQSQQKHK